MKEFPENLKSIIKAVYNQLKNYLKDLWNTIKDANYYHDDIKYES